MDVSIAKEALSPADLIASTQPIAPRGVIKVRGQVTQIRPGKSRVFGDLSSTYGAGSITFNCPLDAAPSCIGQNVVIEGGLSIESAYKKPGFVLNIKGSCIGSYDPPQVTQVSMPDRGIKIPLSKFLEEKKRYALLGTQKGINDAIQAGALSDYQRVVSQENSSNILKAAQSLLKSGADGICFVRGGSDNSLDIWHDPAFVAELVDLSVPFFTALGHADFISLADQYADECFLVPVHLGIATADINKSITDKSNLMKKVADLRREITDLEITLSKKMQAHQYELVAEQEKNSELKNEKNTIEKMAHNRIFQLKQAHAEQLKFWKTMTALTGFVTLMTILMFIVVLVKFM